MPDYEPLESFLDATDYSWKFIEETSYGSKIFQVEAEIDRKIRVGSDDNVIKLDGPAYPGSDRHSGGRGNLDRKAVVPEDSAEEWVLRNFDVINR